MSNDAASNLASLRQAAARHFTTLGDSTEIYRDLHQFIVAANDASSEVVLLGALNLSRLLCCGPHCIPVD